MFISGILYSKQDPFLQRLETFSFNKPDFLQAWKRIAYLATPLLCLHPLGAQSASLGMGVYQVIALGHDLLDKVSHREWKFAISVSLKIVFVASCLFLSLSFPLFYALASTALHILLISLEIRHLRQLDKKQIAALVFQCVAHLFYLHAHINLSWESLGLSLFFQGLEEIVKAFSQHALPEAFVYCLVGTFHLAQTKPLALRLYRDLFAQKLTQSQWETFYAAWQKSNEGQEKPVPFNLDALLNQHHISGRIHHIDFTRTKNLSHIQAAYLKFIQCNFFNTFIDYSQFQFSHFSDCNFQEATCLHSLFSQCLIVNANLTLSAFARCMLQDVHIFSSRVNSVCFNRSSLIRTLFAHSSLQQASFLDATSRQGVLWNCDLQNTLLLRAKEGFYSFFSTPNIQTEPVIALPWDFYNKGQFSPLIAKALKDNGATVLFLDGVSEDINPVRLGQEIEEVLAHLSQEKIPPTSSLAKELLKRAPPDSEVRRIIHDVERLIPYIQGAHIPGNGFDVHPQLYGKNFYTKSFPAPDYRKEILELALINLKEKQIPIMGTCRGAQLINIWAGGDLKEDVSNQFFVWQQNQFSKSSISINLKYFLDNSDPFFIGYSAHHQAIQKLGHGIDVVLSFNGIPKMVASVDRMLFGTQIHPEYYIVLQERIKTLEQISPLSSGYPDIWKKLELYKKIINSNKSIYKWWVKNVQSRS